MPRVLFVSLAALVLTAPLHHSLLAQQRADARAATASDARMAMLPMASTAAEARRHATLGQRALDMGRATEAAEHFREAIGADSTFAFAHLGAANASTSFSEYDAAISAAARHAHQASRAEQLQIEIAQKTLVSDYVAAEALARDLVAAEPKNPRALLALATVQQQMGKEAQARVSMKRAVAIAPRFSPAYLQLAFSYMTSQPTDPPSARPYVERLVALEPKEFQAFIAQGSYFRATNQLPLARRAYTRAAALDPNAALPLQQRGHVESFLGNYDAARADYDAAIKLGKRNDPASYRMFRAFVAAHAGNPKESIAELERLVGEIDGMNLPDPTGAKLGALTAQVQIATQIGDVESASRAIAQRTPLVREQVAGASDAKVKRLVEADIAYYDGLLAARQGDASTAKAKADDIMRIVAETTDPERNQPAHAILGALALEQKDFADAARHLAQANQNDMYVLYQRALALEGAGRTSEAKRLFRKIARFNFNSASVAVSRTDAAKRAR